MVMSGDGRHGAKGVRPYGKPWISLQQQAELLSSRGLRIDDPDAATALLDHLSYYRLSGFCLAFELERHRFSADASFEQVDAAHLFDVSLRGYFDQALEVVEIDLRAAIASRFGQRYQAFGHCDASSFHSVEAHGGGFRHSAWMERSREETMRSRELFVQHFAATYREYPDLPIWMLTEVLSFGALSKMFAGMHRVDQREIAFRYGLQPQFFESWLHHFVYVRNICAHHGRVWDRLWSVKPRLPPHSGWQSPLVPTNERPYATLVMLGHMLRRVRVRAQFANAWAAGVSDLLARLPAAPEAASRLGLPSDWCSHRFWLSSR